MQAAQSASPQQSLRLCGMRRCHKRNAAVLRRHHCLGFPIIADLIADDHLRIHRSVCNFNAERTGIPCQNIQAERRILQRKRQFSSRIDHHGSQRRLSACQSLDDLPKQGGFALARRCVDQRTAVAVTDPWADRILRQTARVRNTEIQPGNIIDAHRASLFNCRPAADAHPNTARKRQIALRDRIPIGVQRTVANALHHPVDLLTIQYTGQQTVAAIHRYGCLSVATQPKLLYTAKPRRKTRKLRQQPRWQYRRHRRGQAPSVGRLFFVCMNNGQCHTVSFFSFCFKICRPSDKYDKLSAIHYDIFPCPSTTFFMQNNHNPTCCSLFVHAFLIIYCCKKRRYMLE